MQHQGLLCRICPMRLFTLLSVLLLATWARADDERPNVLFILVDDLGWSDIGPFGGEIPTPNLDDLAAAGTRYTNFHTAMKCNPTRAMLLTGLDNNLAATGGRRDWRVLPGVPTLAEKLRDAGYQTLMSGKWDAGSGDGQWPHDRGFEQTYALLGAVASHFSSPGGFGSNYAANGQPFEPPADFYSTRWYTDRMLELINARDRERPFFAYLSYTAPHYPLHAPAEYIDAFDGWYEDGYRAVHEKRVARLRDMGLLGPDTAPWSLENVPEWHSLSDSERAYETKRMQVYAAMIAALDDGIGKVLQHLADEGLGDNTVVLFASDNGADGTPGGAGFDEKRHSNTVATLGTPGSYATQGFNWAQTSSTPFRMVKSHPTEGGYRSPMIARWPGRIDAGGINDEWFIISDLHETILDIAGARRPRDRDALAGRSALKLLTGGEPVYDKDEVRIHTYVEGRRLGGANVVKGDWKLVWWKTNNVYGAPMLFDIAKDPNETTDLAAEHPGIVADLVAEWRQYAARIGESIAEANPDL